MRPTTPLHILISFVIAALFGCDSPQKPAPAKVHIVKDLASRPEPLGVMIDRIATDFDIPPVIAFNLVDTESAFDENALSKTNAVGLAQVLRSTARAECGIEKLHILAKPNNNLRCGFSYLAKLKSQFGSWDKALIAYNAGPGIMQNPKRNPSRYVEGVLYAKSILKGFKS